MIRLENLGTVNRNKVIIGNLTLWFSYETIVAFQDETGLKCSENIWSRTTGKLLNMICDKNERIPNKDFERELRLCLIRHNFYLEKVVEELQEIEA